MDRLRINLAHTGLRLKIRLLTVLIFGVCAQPATAGTATFVEPSTLDNASISAISTSGDGDGAFLGLGDTLALLFDMPFGTQPGENVSVFTAAPSTGRTTFRVQFGVYDGGSPTFVFRRNIRAGRRVSVNNLFQRGCSAFGGCDYIEITNIRNRRGATGADVDYVAVDGEVTDVTSPTPEPSVWTMMILGFCGIAWRLKLTRKGQLPRLDKEGSLSAATKTSLQPIGRSPKPRLRDCQANY